MCLCALFDVAFKMVKSFYIYTKSLIELDKSLFGVTFEMAKSVFWQLKKKKNLLIMFDKKRNRNAFIMIFLQHTKSFARFDIRLESWRAYIDYNVLKDKSYPKLQIEQYANIILIHQSLMVLKNHVNCKSWVKYSNY